MVRPGSGEQQRLRTRVPARFLAFEQQLGERDFFSIDELCPDDPSAEPLAAHFAIGRGDDFSLFLFVFENVLPALTSAKFYNDLLQGRTPEAMNPSGDYVEDVRRALGCVQHLSKSLVENSENFTWASGIDAVKQRAALFTVTGDWGNLQLKTEIEAGTIRMVPFPGSENTFVYTADTFPLPVKAQHAPETLEFLEYMADPATQGSFSDEKGSIPARMDAPIGDSLHDLRLQTRQAFGSTQHALAISGLQPPYFPHAELLSKLRQLVSNRTTVDDVLSEFMAALPLLSRWQEQLHAE